MSDTATSERLSASEFARRAGCDEKQVRRAIEGGKLTRGEDGKLDAAQLNTAWRRPRVDSKANPVAKSSDMPSTDKKHVRPDAGADAPEVRPAGSSLLKDAVTRKEDYAGRLKELEYLKQSGQLVELEVARRVLFDDFRAFRDRLLNWPSRVSSLMAADLGVEADKLSDVLTSHVHKLLAQLAEPAGEFK